MKRLSKSAKEERGERGMSETVNVLGNLMPCKIAASSQSVGWFIKCWVGLDR